MKKIKLTQNKFTLVDNEDFELLSKHKWYALRCKSTGRYYVRRHYSINGKQRVCIMARELMGLKYGDKRKVDHINHNTLDNRKENLRVCSNAENGHNRVSNYGVSRYKGVSKSRKNWMSRIMLNGKRIYLGYFKNEKDAAMAYNRAALRYYGKFAYLNDV
jgi:hypothetical protein